MQNGVGNGENAITNVDALVVGAGFSGVAMLVSSSSSYVNYTDAYSIVFAN